MKAKDTFIRPSQMFKSQLQEYAQKARLAAPVYNTTMLGPSNHPQFKASVTIQGETYISPTFFTNLRAAEHAAAQVALTALGAKSGSNIASLQTLHESGLCKSMLQEYAQKNKLQLPVYTTRTIGEKNPQSFCATVEIAGICYTGGLCKTRKVAEIMAARAALLAIYSNSDPQYYTDFQRHQPSIVLQNEAVVFAGPSLIHGIKRKELSNGQHTSIQESKKVLLDGHFKSPEDKGDGPVNEGCLAATGDEDVKHETNGSSALS